MDTVPCLRDTITQSHDELAERLESACVALPLPHQTQRGCPPIDLFLSEVSRHLHAVDEVLLPTVRDQALVRDYLRSERDLGVALALDADRALAVAECEELSSRLHAAEDAAPTRPHPYLPHTGGSGKVARGVMRVADRAWDAVEGRFTRHPDPVQHKAPGPIGQYLTGQTHFEDEEEDYAGEPR